MKKMLITIAVILVILGTAYFFLIAPKPATAAVLYIEEGNVQVDTGKGWLAATDEMELGRGNKVKTESGQATIVFYEGEIMHLQPNTEVEITQLTSRKVKVDQKGETWNKITKLSGIAEFTIETPNTVATVRGTEFIINNELLGVEEGNVEYGPTNNPRQLMVGSGNYANYLKMQEEQMIEELRAKFGQFPNKYVKILKKVRAREVRKHKTILNMVKERGYSEQQVLAKLEQIDNGTENEDKMYQQIPGIMKPKAKRTYLLTKEIKRTLNR